MVYECRERDQLPQCILTKPNPIQIPTWQQLYDRKAVPLIFKIKRKKSSSIVTFRSEAFWVCLNLR